ALARARVLVVDKTGTLTEGRPRVAAVAAASDSDAAGEGEVLRLAAALERGSEHPLASAVLAAAAERGLAVPEAKGHRSWPGEGIEAEVEGVRVAVGNARLLQRLGVAPGPLEERAERERSEGRTVAYLVAGERTAGVL